MKKTNLEKIKEIAQQAQGIKTAVIMYNFDELPEHKEIKKDSFFGVTAKYLEECPANSVRLTYTM